jgi:hypothetical protein
MRRPRTRAVRYYLIHLEGCVEPGLVGPFPSERVRDMNAKRMGASHREPDALFWLDVAEEGTPLLGAYPAGLIEETDPSPPRGQ